MTEIAQPTKQESELGMLKQLVMIEADQAYGYSYTNFDLPYLETRTRMIEKKVLAERKIDYQAQLEAWKGAAFCPCIIKRGSRAGQVCNSKVCVIVGDGTRCYIHRKSNEIMQVNQLPAPAPPAPPAPIPKNPEVKK
jgi:hypothetical protein